MNGALTAEASTQLFEGINLVLSRWTALRMAVENQWGGPDSLNKSQYLGEDLFRLLTKSRERVYFEDVLDMLEDSMLSFNTEVEDGSLEEVAEKLMIMHEECSEGNFNSITKLKETNPPSISYAAQPSKSSEDEDSDNECKKHEMEIDVQASVSANETTNTTSTQEVADNDGWSVVTTKRNKGKKK